MMLQIRCTISWRNSNSTPIPGTRYALICRPARPETYYTLEQRKKAQAYAYPHCGAISEEKLRPTLTGKLFREINFNKLMPNQLVVKFLNFFSKSQTETLFHFHSVISCWTIPRALRQEAVLKQHRQHKRTACIDINNYQQSNTI